MPISRASNRAFWTRSRAGWRPPLARLPKSQAGHRAYDLLRGDEAYKAHWRAQPRACADIRVWPGEGADWVRRGAWQARENMKYWVKGAWQWAGAFDPRGRAAPHVSPRQR